MNALSYQGEGEVGDKSGWGRKDTIACTQSGCVVVRWEHEDGTVYLAVRGSQCRRDTLDDLRVFLGQPPKARITFLEGYIEQHCDQARQDNKLLVGGHSLGGLVAMGAAARWKLPGLVQNSPGWLVNPPPAESLAQMVELRTGRDAVGVWGHSIPTTVTLHDPEAGRWDVIKLHNIHRQMDLVQRNGLTHVPLDDPSLHQNIKPLPRFESAPGTIGWMKATWAKIHEDHEQGLAAPTHKPRIPRP